MKGFNMTDLIKKYEGLRLEAYKCPAGVWTIGYGNTTHPDGTPVKQGDMITDVQAEAYLNDYLIRNVYPVFGKIPYTLSMWQKEALSSLIYNWNAGGFLKSKLYKAICARDWAEVMRQWDFGLKDGLKGLVKRRAEELAMFMRDV